jgi:hypothetical protein
MIEKGLDIVGRLGDWYLLKYGTYTKVYITMKPPHMLPEFVLYRMVL